MGVNAWTTLEKGQAIQLKEFGHIDALYKGYDTVAGKSASAYVYFYTSNSKMPNFKLWHSCRKGAICLIYAFHTPTKELFIKLDKLLKFTLKYTSISLLHDSVYDHHQGACTAPG